MERGLNNENLKRKSREECVLVYTTVRNEGDVFVAQLWRHVTVAGVTLCCAACPVCTSVVLRTTCTPRYHQRVLDRFFGFLYMNQPM